MFNNEKNAQDLESILNELEASNLDDLTEEELTTYYRKLNPYGRIIEGSDKILTFSYTNLREEYMKKLLLTGMVGFLNRACDEYLVPDGLKIIPVYDYLKNPSLIDEFSKDWQMNPKLEKELADNKKAMEKRVIIKEWLEDLFQYNPDVHVRSVYKPCPKDIARNVIDTPAANLAISELKGKNVEFREQMLEFDRLQKLMLMKEPPLERTGEKVDEALEKLVADKLILPDTHYSTMDYENWSAEDKDLLRTTCEMIPPADTFHKFKNYYETNYDKLRESALYLYADKPDYEIAICPHEWHNTVEDANEYMKKHRGEVISDIIKAHSGKWNIHAPLKEVRESVQFFNENTIVLEQIAEQIESDNKMGSELMKNTIKKKKRQNIEEDGPDAELFADWKKNNTQLKDMKAVTLDDDELLMQQTPDDAICVPVFRVSDSGKLTKDHFFTKSVAPIDNNL